MTRTRLGKIVGSYKPPLQAFTYWQENGEWYVIAPSGAKIETCASEREARDSTAIRNREWNA